MARVRPQPSSHVYEGLHQQSESQNFRSEKVRFHPPSHTKNMGLSKFRWLAQAQINYTEIRLGRYSDKKHY